MTTDALFVAHIPKLVVHPNERWTTDEWTLQSYSRIAPSELFSLDHVLHRLTSACSRQAAKSASLPAGARLREHAVERQFVWAWASTLAADAQIR